MMLRVSVMLSAAVIASMPGRASAHCDTADGPVAKAVTESLESKRLDATLVWLKADAEAEISAVFKRALTVRELSPEARELADRSFLETAIRLHRAGEGEPFTGVKPAGTDPGPAVRAADEAIAANSLGPVEKVIAPAHWTALAERFKPLAGKPVPPKDVVQGRRWVEAYVGFVHAVDGAYRGATQGCGHGKQRAGPEPERAR